MRILGIDFTSAPSRRKPIVCCQGSLNGDTLQITGLERWHAFEAFEQLLSAPGEWVAAMDFPFGQPRQLVGQLGWPEDWEQYVQLVGSQTKAEFVEMINRYRADQPAGKKHHLRTTDTLAGACSPMMLYGVPVGKMFFEGAPRLQAAEVSVLPCRPTDSNKIAIEGYPALVARHLIGSQRYKGEASESLRQSRERMLERLNQKDGLAAYNLRIELPSDLLATLVEDQMGDDLDALSCSIQAAASELSKSSGYGIPIHADKLEGWIVDPTITRNDA